jgi:hypothetical protein
LLPVWTARAKVVIMLSALGGASIDIRAAPGYCIALEIWAVPVFCASWPLHERREPLFSHRIGAHIEIIQIEYSGKPLDGLLSHGHPRPLN